MTFPVLLPVTGLCRMQKHPRRKIRKCTWGCGRAWIWTVPHKLTFWVIMSQPVVLFRNHTESLGTGRSEPLGLDFEGYSPTLVLKGSFCFLVHQDVNSLHASIHRNPSKVWPKVLSPRVLAFCQCGTSWCPSEEGTSTEQMPPLDWLGGKSVGFFLIDDWCWRPQPTLGTILGS